MLGQIYRLITNALKITYKYETKEEVMNAVSKIDVWAGIDFSQYEFLEFNPKLKNDSKFMKEFFSEKIIKKWMLNEFTIDELKKNIWFVSKCVRLKPESIQYSNRILINNSLVIEALLENGIEYYENTNSKLKNDPDFILKLIAKGNALKVFNNGRNIYTNLIRLADFELMDNSEFMAKAIEYDSRAFHWASHRLCSTKELVLKFININPDIYIYIDYDLKQDKDISLLAFSKGIIEQLA